MAKNILQLNFPPSSNEGVFLIDDISFYNSDIKPRCGNLQITPPGFTTATTIDVTPGFRLVLNACMLGFLPANDCTECAPGLPDGLYNIRYSVAPNDKVFVEYKIFRTVEATNKYKSLLGNIGLSPCLPDKEMQYQLQQLDLIRNYLECAKVTVEDIHQFTDGMNLYRYALDCIEKMQRQPNRC